MTGELFINGKDAYKEWGVNMGKGFLDALDEPAGLKGYITNDSKLKDGVDYCDMTPKVNERQVTLTFTITVANQDDYRIKRKAFLNELYNGNVSLKIPSMSEDVYHLKYKDSTGAYAQNLERTFCKIGVKFIEPNPENRE